MWIISLILLAVALFAFISIPFLIRADYSPVISAIIGIVATLVGILLWVLSAGFSLNPGEAAVLRAWSGSVVEDPVTEEGWHWKDPWVDVNVFDVRNQRAVFVGADSNSSGDNQGGAADGIYITVQDAEGVSANVDIIVRYSIDPASVVKIFREFGSEQNFRSQLILTDIRSVVRQAPGDFTTLEVLTQREAVADQIFADLERRWEGDGIIVEDVALQEILYPESVRNAFASAQEAQIAVERARAELERQQIEAQQLVQTAQAQADANGILNSQPLSEASLSLRYLETLEKLAAAGNLVVVPDGFGGIVNVAR